MNVLRKTALLPAVLLGCAHGRTPQQDALIRRGDCAELLRAADLARAQGDAEVAAGLAAACSPDKLAALVESSPPAQALLWCGRVAATQQKGCDSTKTAELAAKLHPHLTVGPPDEATPPDPLLQGAFEQLGNDLNLSWDPADPDVVVGRLTVSLDHVTSSTVAQVNDAKGNQQRVPATQHRFVARAEAQVELGSKTRTLRAVEEVRDVTWNAVPRLAVAAKFDPQAPPPEEMKKRAAQSWLRVLARALAAAPPEAVDVTDDKGCVAYGLSINLNSGDPFAASSGAGEPAKISACEKLLGEPAGAGIPVP